MSELDPIPVQTLTYRTGAPVRVLSRSARLAIIVAMITAIVHFLELQALPRVIQLMTMDLGYSRSLQLTMDLSILVSWAGGLLIVAGGIVTLATRGERRRLFLIGCLIAASGATAWLAACLADATASTLVYGLSRSQFGMIQRGGVDPFISAVALHLLAFFLVRRNSDEAGPL